MDYFYAPPEKISKGAVLIDGDEFSHLTHVMRKKVGDEIRVVDGLGTAYDVRLSELKKKAARGSILGSHPRHHEPERSVVLAAAILKNPSKFDFLVEKVSEIGVREIIPIATERTIPSHAKVDRWQKLALAAMKQCGRSYLPRVRELVSLDTLLADKRLFDLKLIAHERPVRSAVSKKQGPEYSGSVLVIIGPEGGFTDEEVEQCLVAGCRTLYLGERRLRTETAAIVAAAILVEETQKLT